MDKIWNINVILCEKSDVKVTNIKNIFDTLKIRNNSASFSMVTLMTAICSDENKFGLYYYIEKVTEGNSLRTYLGSTIYSNSGNEGKDRSGEIIQGTLEQCSTMMISEDVECFEFPGTGQYELQVYKYDDEKAIDINDRSDVEKDKWADREHLVSIYPFKVKIGDE